MHDAAYRIEDKNVPVGDMGFLYGFSLFETFLVNRGGSIFLLDKHMDRLLHSIRFFNFNTDIGKDELARLVLKYIDDNGIQDKIFRIAITCGNKPKNIKSSIVVTLRENTYGGEHYLRGFRLYISTCKKSESSLILRHKTSNYLENYLVAQQAAADGFDDAIYLNTKDELTETTKSNLFFVSKGILYTPDIDCGLLPGVIRAWVMEKAKDLGIECVQGHYTAEMLLGAEEAFATNSVMGIMPVSSINSSRMKDGAAGKTTRLFMKEYGCVSGCEID